jgi:uncharacterized protein YndB with AHSA1/START domain
MNKPSSLTVDTPSDREVRVTRKFKAPTRLVWDAHTKPELVRKWQYGFEGWSLPICEMDVRAGGAYRWRWRNDDDGQEMGFLGKYLEVTPHTRLVYDQLYDPGSLGIPMTSEPTVITTEFTESGEFTTLTMTMLFASKEERDAAVATGMTDGMELSYQRMDALFSH